MSRLIVIITGVMMTACVGAQPEAVPRENPASPTVADTVATSTTGPDATAETTAPAPITAAPPAYEMEECGDAPPIEFAVLCDVYPDIIDFYVDPVTADQLVNAAAFGMSSVPVDLAAVVPEGSFRCVVPDPDFEKLCASLADRFANRPATLQALMEGAVHGMFRYGLDPFSTYLAGSILDAPFDLSGSVPELGLTVGARDDSGAACGPIGPGCTFQVLSVFDFGPAGGAGIAVGDVIVAVDGEPVDGKSGDEVTVLLVGVAGTEVIVTIDRDGLASERSLVRQDIRYQPAEFEMLGDVAYLRLNEFSQVSAQALGDVLQTPDVSSALGIVLDLRDNPGGLVLAAQAVASQFLDGGLVMVEEGRDFTDEIEVLPGGYATDGPQMVVVVNRGTASSAEIVAAVLQERNRALVVGEPTFGKNLVQYVTETRDGGQVALTIARWSTPEGLDVKLDGLEPDVLVATPGGPDGDPALDTALGLLGG